MANTQGREITDSRVGPVVDLGRVCLEISNHDTFRIPLLQKRGFNPFFSLAEFSWLITGSNLVEPLSYFLPGFTQYSDDGKTLNGAYGYRLRSNGKDQIADAIKELRRNRNTRRVVLNTWNMSDLGSQSRDVPCNTSVMFKIRNGFLDMTVINRSNDLYLGLPYNVVMFYLLQNYIAREIGCPVGTQCHFIDSLHLYTKHTKRVNEIVSNNSPEGIIASFQKYGRFDLAQYIRINHEVVVDRAFEQIDDPVFRDYFLSIENFRESRDFGMSLKSLPKNLLGYSAFLWYTERNGYDRRKLDEYWD